jgi:hypothetical protein
VGEEGRFEKMVGRKIFGGRILRSLIQKARFKNENFGGLRMKFRRVLNTKFWRN